MIVDVSIFFPTKKKNRPSQKMADFFSIDEVTAEFFPVGNAVALNYDPVIINAPSNGQVLTYENGVWVNEAGGGGGGNATSIQSVPVTFTAPGTGNVIAFSDATHLVNQPAGNVTESISNVLTVTGGSGASLKNVSLEMAKGSGAVDGYIAATDWTLFNAKLNPVATPTANDLLFTNGAGQPIDSGLSIGNDGTSSTVPNSLMMTSYVTNAILNTTTLPFVHFASTANVASLSGLGAVDGYTPTAGQFILLKNQTSQDNGIWIVAAGAWTRALNNGTSWVPVTTETTYIQLNIQNGVVNVLNGTINKNLQFQISILNPLAVFGASSVFVTTTIKIPVRDIKNGYVNANTGNNTNNNGTLSFPYATVTQDLTGASYPHITYLSNGSYSESLTITSGQSNLTLICLDTTTAGKLSFSTPVILATGNTRYREKGITRSTGASIPIVINSGNLGRHTFEDCVWITSGTELIHFPANMTNWISFYNIDSSSSPLASIVIPNFTAPFIINIYNQTNLLPFTLDVGATGLNCTLNVVNCPKGSVVVPAHYAGILNWFDGIAVNNVITSQVDLTSILNNVVLSGFYAVSFASPVGMSEGVIFEKFSGGGFTSNVITEPYLTGKSSAIFDLTTLQTFVKTTRSGFNGWMGGLLTGLSGEVTATGPGIAAATISSHSVTNAKMAQMAAHTWKGNASSLVTDPVDNLTGGLTEAISSVLTIDGGAHCLLASATLEVKQSSAVQDGYLASADYSRFDLTHPVTATIANPSANTLAVFNGSGDIVAPTTLLPASAMPGLTGEAFNTPGFLATTLSNSAVVGKILTGYSPALGTIGSSDSIGSALEKTGASLNTASGQVIVGSIGGIATPVALSGDATLASTGAITLGNSAVTGKFLTGYTSTAGVIVGTDSLLQAFQKTGKSLSTTAGQVVVGNASNVATATTLSGDATVSSTGVVTVPTMIGATSLVNGTKGLAPQPLIADLNLLLGGGGTYVQGGFLNLIKFTANGSYTPGAGCNRFIVHVLGGGSGGQDVPASATMTAGGGGGGGGLQIAGFNVVAGLTGSVNIGGGGAGTGVGGATSLFAYNALNIYGNGGSVPNSAANSNTVFLMSRGGDGGAGSGTGTWGSSTTVYGGNGVDGYVTTVSKCAKGGDGGSSAYGVGGKGVTSNGITSSWSGIVSRGYGAGGSGAVATDLAATVGNAGLNGLVMIFEYR